MKYLNYDIRSLNQSGEKLNVAHGLQHLMSIKHSNQIEQKKWEFFLESLITAERSCPRSAEFMLELIKGKNILHGDMPYDKNSLIDYFESIGIHRKNLEMLSAVMENSTMDTVITIHDSNNEKNYIEVISGHRFNLKPALLKANKTYKKPRIICIDGYVENVSELHNLFTEISEKRVECFLACRGLSNDVLHTVKVNNDRGTLCIRPYVVPYDLGNANTLVDIAVVSGGDVVSSLKGDLISTTGLSRSGSVDEVLEFNESILIKSSHHERIRLHIEKLKRDREEKIVATNFIDERLKSLNASSIRVFISHGIDNFEAKRQLDIGIRIFGFVIKNCFDPISIAKIHHQSYSRLTSNMFTMSEEEGNINMEEDK